jgi:hypothetical protein
MHFARYAARANGYGEMEFIITPETIYILVDHIQDDRRIFTDRRD